MLYGSSGVQIDFPCLYKTSHSWIVLVNSADLDFFFPSENWLCESNVNLLTIVLIFFIFLSLHYSNCNLLLRWSFCFPLSSFSTRIEKREVSNYISLLCTWLMDFEMSGSKILSCPFWHNILSFSKPLLYLK